MGSEATGFLEWKFIELPDCRASCGYEPREKQLCRWSPGTLTLSWGDSTFPLTLRSRLARLR